MPLGTEVGLGPPTGHCVRYGPSYPQKKGTPTPPNFWPICLLWPNGWMDEDAAWYGSRPRPRPHCTRRGPSCRERGTAAPFFRPMSIVATVAHLIYCWALVVHTTARGSVLLWRQRNTLRTSGFVDDVTFAHNRPDNGDANKTHWLIRGSALRVFTIALFC